MKRYFLMILCVLTACLCAAGCDPSPTPSSGSKEETDTGLSQEELWALLETGTNKSWSNDTYMALFERKDGKYFYNQFTRDEDLIRPKFAAVSNFAYQGGGVYTFMASYPGFGTVPETFTDVTLKLDPKQVDEGGITLSCIKHYEGSAEYALLQKTNTGYTQNDYAYYMEVLRSYGRWENSTRYFDVTKEENGSGYLITMATKNSGDIGTCHVVELKGITEDGMAVFQLHYDGYSYTDPAGNPATVEGFNASMYLKLNLEEEVSAELKFSDRLKDYAGLYKPHYSGTVEDDLTYWMEYLRSNGYWEKHNAFFTVGKNTGTGSYKINFAIKQSEAFTGPDVVAYKGSSTDGYEIFDLHLEEYSYQFHDQTVTVPGYDEVMYLKPIEAAGQPQVELKFYGKLSDFSGVYTSSAETGMTWKALWALLSKYRWNGEFADKVSFKSDGNGYQIVINDAAYPVQKCEVSGKEYLICFGGVGENIFRLEIRNFLYGPEYTVADITEIKIQTSLDSTGPVSLNEVFYAEAKG